MSMVISALKDKQSIYIDAHAEQSYTGSFLADKGDYATNISQGIYGKELTKETLRNIWEYVELQPQTTVLIIDFGLILDVQINQQDLIKDIKKHVTKLILINVSEQIIAKLNIDLYPENKALEGVYTVFQLSDTIEQMTFKKIDVLFEKKFVQLLKNKSLTHKNPIDSFRPNSPIYVPKFIDIKQMMVADTPFFIFILYRLAKDILNKKEWKNKCQTPILFCQNLNGAFVASVLSSFLQWDILSMDHIGPVNKMYSNIGNKVKADFKYIVVSDVVCLGTEIRICQNVINYSGGKYIGNVSIINIETLRKEHDGRQSISVFSITKNNNPIDYNILTALDF